MENNSVRKKPIGRPRLRLDYIIKKDVESLNGGPDCPKTLQQIIGKIGGLYMRWDGLNG